MSAKSKESKIYIFLESWLIPLILFAFIVFTLLNYYFNLSIQYDFFIEKSSEALYNIKSSLMSIAAIFIGVYVTVFTLLGSIKVDSIFAYLNENTFKKLISYIRNAFIASFSFLILEIVLEISYEKYDQINIFWVVLGITLVMYMFLTALRFGVIIYIAFSKDLENLQENIETHKKEREEVKELRYKLKQYLNAIEEKNSKKKSEIMSEKIKKDKNKK